MQVEDICYSLVILNLLVLDYRLDPYTRIKPTMPAVN